MTYNASQIHRSRESWTTLALRGPASPRSRAGMANFDADIFFATDFDWLSRAYASSGGVGAVAAAAPPAEFFVRAPDLAAATSTRSGYNPLLEDFWNTRIFLAPGQGVA